jgi:hypothetical protein
MTSLIIAAVLAAVGTASESTSNLKEQAAEQPPHQVVAMYFHRTVRCPTCKKIGTLAEEAVVKGFEKEVDANVVEFLYVDFQDRKNAQYVKAYKIEGPTLVLANVFEGKVVRWTAMPKVWPMVGKPVELQAYVQDGVAKYLKQTREEAESQE